MIILYGGSFDPPHKSHVALLQRALSENDGAKAVVVPAWRSPLKTVHFASSDDRLAMCRLSFPFATIDDIEMWSIQRHTIGLVRYYVKTHENDEIRFLMGSDCADEFIKWKDSAEFSAIPRFGFISYKREGVVSSTNIRRAIALGSSISGDDLPNEVFSYIKRRGLYGYKA